MTIKIEYLDEPKLQFGEYFEHEDTKTGLAEFGPFGKNVAGLHLSEIKLGFIGTRETITGAQEWVERCGSFIESENVEIIGQQFTEGGFFPGLDASTPTLRRLHKILNRDFVGFNKESSFQSCFQTNPRWDRHLDARELSQILEIENKSDRIWKLVDLIDDRLDNITQTAPTPNIVVIALTPQIEEQAHSIRLSGNFFLNLRRAIKARAMSHKTPIPVQLLRQRTIKGKGDVQEVATRAWNFCTAQYYKAGGIPWRPITLEENTCYIGISFYVAQDIDSTLTMRSSVAQAFDYLGQGLVLRGDQFEWDSYAFGPSPHLTREAAKKLIRETLRTCLTIRA